MMNKYLLSIYFSLLLMLSVSGQEAADHREISDKKQLKESYEEQRARSILFSFTAGPNYRKEIYSEPIVFHSAIAGPGESISIALSRNRFYSYTRAHLEFNEFKERFKLVRQELFINDWQRTGIKTFTIGISRGTYLRGLTGGRRILSLEGGIDVSFSDYKTSVTEYYKDESTNGLLQITGYSLGSYPLAHVGLGTSIRFLGLAYWDFSVTYYQGLMRMYQYTYDYNNWKGLDGYTEHTNNGSFLAIKTGITLALL